MSAATEPERIRWRRVLGVANWLVGSTRPDIANLNAWLQQCVSKAQVSDVVEANRRVSLIKDHASMSVRYRGSVFMLATDASWSNNPDLRSQAGHWILFADSKLVKEGWAAVSAQVALTQDGATHSVKFWIRVDVFSARRRRVQLDPIHMTNWMRSIWRRRVEMAWW